MSLKKYQQKRNFAITKEPKGKVQKTKSSKLKYVIQHHWARKEHFDLRLEYNGVYVSFAVPKGPSYNAKDKRLAVKVEDHPLSYGSFEGNIPKGEYGAGTVMLFDKGYWHPNNEHKPDFNKGTIKFTINGKRLKGSFALIKVQGENNWLLIKEHDKYENQININDFKTSIKTGRTMKEIAGNIHMTKKEKTINITSPDKIIFAKDKITKEDIFNYYQKVGKRIMPYLENRLISTVRCPNGNLSDTFYMKHLSDDNKDAGKKLIKGTDSDKRDYYYFKNINGLLYEVQMNSFEFHIWGCPQNSINVPDLLVFDLDPDKGLSLDRVRQGAKDLKKVLDKLKLKSYLKTSGGKGYHIYVPLKCPSWKKLEEISAGISKILVESYPERYTTNMRKEKRKNKIFIDYFRNKKGATSVCPYSLRLKDKPAVSCPISWKELDTVKPDEITIKNIDARLKKKDPWSGFFK